MAREKLQFRPFDYDALPEEIKLQLAIIDEAKAAINAKLAEALPQGYKAQHSYKLDYAAGKRVFKVAVYRASQVKAQAPVLPKGNLSDWIASQVNGGHSV